MARPVVPQYPHHVTQRGNGRLPAFFSDDDYLAYLKLRRFRGRYTYLRSEATASIIDDLMGPVGVVPAEVVSANAR